jgi:hypothetical protein
MIGVYIRPTTMTVEQYKAIDQEVRAVVGSEPKGMKLHTCFERAKVSPSLMCGRAKRPSMGSRPCLAQSLPPQESSPLSP